ncbi:hypothetical protein QTO34_001023 [Cnephaeus nilssonii]|uniref:Uncharacterized protein n=1 Tax=Cnephaeus nilssonii TaxID=3371016 RepID=A0AA40LLB8_CNENI|nr:hypothetical protein QTO34_001023 [Eptesicus nilssonii]
MSRRACSCSPSSSSSSSCSCSAVTAPRRPASLNSCRETSLSIKMKCDFNYNHVHSEVKLVKPDDMEG